MDHGCLTKSIVQIVVNLFCINSQCANSNWNIISIMISNWPKFNESKSHNLIAQIMQDFSPFQYSFFLSNSQLEKTEKKLRRTASAFTPSFVMESKTENKMQFRAKNSVMWFVDKSHCWKSIRLQGPPLILKSCHLKWPTDLSFHVL